MELYVFDKDLNFKGILEGYSSLRWIRRYSKHGEFELHCSLTVEVLELLKKDNIIWKKDDDEAGYIEYRNLKQDPEGKEILIVKGKFLTGYFERRIIWEVENLNCTSELAIRTLIDKNCINPVDKDRIIPNLVLNSLKAYSERLNYQVSYKNLLDEIESLSNTNDLGFKIIFDIKNRNLLFDLYKGKDLTVNQVKNPPCIFSKEFENVLEQEYTDSLNNYRNVSLVAGAGEGVERKCVSIGHATGLDRFELFTDARDLQETREENDKKVTISKEEYEKILIQRGNEKLSECKEIQTFDSKINVKSNLIYKVDYDLGDIVTCTSKRWNITVDTRIVEIEEVYDQSGVSINIVFGNNIPTILDKIKQNLK